MSSVVCLFPEITDGRVLLTKFVQSFIVHMKIVLVFEKPALLCWREASGQFHGPDIQPVSIRVEEFLAGIQELRMTSDWVFVCSH